MNFCTWELIFPQIICPKLNSWTCYSAPKFSLFFESPICSEQNNFDYAFSHNPYLSGKKSCWLYLQCTSRIQLFHHGCCPWPLYYFLPGLLHGPPNSCSCLSPRVPTSTHSKAVRGSLNMECFLSVLKTWRAPMSLHRSPRPFDYLESPI